MLFRWNKLKIGKVALLLAATFMLLAGSAYAQTSTLCFQGCDNTTNPSCDDPDFWEEGVDFDDWIQTKGIVDSCERDNIIYQVWQCNSVYYQCLQLGIPRHPNCDDSKVGECTDLTYNSIGGCADELQYAIDADATNCMPDPPPGDSDSSSCCATVPPDDNSRSMLDYILFALLPILGMIGAFIMRRRKNISQAGSTMLLVLAIFSLPLASGCTAPEPQQTNKAGVAAGVAALEEGNFQEASEIFIALDGCDADYGLLLSYVGLATDRIGVVYGLQTVENASFRDSIPAWTPTWEAIEKVAAQASKVCQGDCYSAGSSPFSLENYSLAVPGLIEANFSGNWTRLEASMIGELAHGMLIFDAWWGPTVEGANLVHHLEQVLILGEIAVNEYIGSSDNVGILGRGKAAGEDMIGSGDVVVAPGVMKVSIEGRGYLPTFLNLFGFTPQAEIPGNMTVSQTSLISAMSGMVSAFKNEGVFSITALSKVMSEAGVLSAPFTTEIALDISKLSNLSGHPMQYMPVQGFNGELNWADPSLGGALLINGETATLETVTAAMGAEGIPADGLTASDIGFLMGRLFPMAVVPR
jgi:hypothetical protein